MSGLYNIEIKSSVCKQYFDIQEFSLSDYHASLEETSNH